MKNRFINNGFYALIRPINIFINNFVIRFH